MSGCRVQDKLAPIAPIRETAITTGYIMDFREGCIKIMRIRPYPPNFRRIPAKIILPATGASTWALGSHKWVTYIGILTKKAIIQNIHQICSWDIDMFEMRENLAGIVIALEEASLIAIKIAAKRGREATVVYIIKYIPACSRSGW